MTVSVTTLSLTILSVSTTRRTEKYVKCHNLVPYAECFYAKCLGAFCIAKYNFIVLMGIGIWVKFVSLENQNKICKIIFIWLVELKNGNLKRHVTKKLKLLNIIKKIYIV